MVQTNNNVRRIYDVTADVHKPVNDGFRVKVSMPDLGVYINGMLVYPPNEEHENWSVYPPATRAGRGKYAYIVEFNKSLPLWAEIHDACVDAVKQEQSLDDTAVLKRPFELDKVIVDIPDGPINLDDIQFE